MPRARIVILSSTGGGGHTAAARALTGLLGDYYEVKVVNVISTILAPLDVVRSVTLDRSSVETLYNTLLRRGWTRLLNGVIKAAVLRLVFAHRRRFRALLTEFLRNERPDLVVSVIPFVNLAASDAAQALALPYLVVVTDGDITNYVDRFDRLAHSDVHLTIMKDNPALDRQVEAFGLRSRVTVHRVGVPLRRQFFITKPAPGAPRDRGVPGGRLVVMLMLGGAGGASLARYARAILALQMDVHLIACVGGNARLARVLSGIERSGRVSLSVQGFTEDIAEIMAASDVLITKPGPGSIQEAIKMELPMLIDNTGPALFWERANIAMVRDHGIGETVDTFRQLPMLIERHVRCPEIRARQRTALRTLSSRISEGELKGVVDGMLARGGGRPVGA